MVLHVVNKVADLVNQGIDAVITYVREHGPAITVLLAVGWFVKTRYIDSFLSKGHVLMTENGNKQGSFAKLRVAKVSNLTREEEMRQVRLRQQEIANRRASEAERQRKEREAQERERRNQIARKKKDDDDGGGERLGSAHTSTDRITNEKTEQSRSSVTNNGASRYNPMQPWTSHSSGYRPARRNPRA